MPVIGMSSKISTTGRCRDGGAQGTARLDRCRRWKALALIDPDVIDHRGGASGDHKGAAAWKQKWEQMDDGVQSTIEHNVASGDFSVNRYTVRGTHTASGRRYEVTGIDMVRVRDGKIVEHWALLDSAAVRHQLGTGEVNSQ